MKILRMVHFTIFAISVLLSIWFVLGEFMAMLYFDQWPIRQILMLIGFSYIVIFAIYRVFKEFN